MALHGTNSVVKSDKGLAALVDDNTHPPDPAHPFFYAQCLALAPVALAFTLGTSLLMQHTLVEQICGGILFGSATLFLMIVEVRWFRK